MNIFSKIKKAMHKGGVILVFKRLFDKVRWSFDRIEFKSAIKHKLTRRLPDVEVVLRPLTSHPDDVDIAKRILLAFRKAQKDEKKVVTGDLWDNIQREWHSDFYAICHDPAKVAEYMNNMNQHGITIAIGSSSLSIYQAMKKNPAIRQEWGILVKDTLVCFAEAVGVLPYNLHGDALYEDESVLLSRVEKKIGATLIPSSIEGGLYKLKIDNRFFDYRDFWSAYIAWRIYELAGSTDSVAEIGGGIGKSALFAVQFGIKNYSIYDLPIINLTQAWYLIKSGVDVALYGEEKHGGVNIMPYWEFSKNSFDLTVNADSFPEMDGSIVADYLETIKKNTRKYLLSINREDGDVYGDNHKHIVVQDIVAKVGGLKRLYRFPVWFFNNYIEELYKLS